MHAIDTPFEFPIHEISNISGAVRAARRTPKEDPVRNSLRAETSHLTMNFVGGTNRDHEGESRK